MLIYLKNMAKAFPQYFKRFFDDYRVLVRVNPSDFSGIELIVHPDGKIEKTEMTFYEEIFDDLAEDEFIHCNVLEFQIHFTKLKGLSLFIHIASHSLTPGQNLKLYELIISLGTRLSPN